MSEEKITMDEERVEVTREERSETIEERIEVRQEEECETLEEMMERMNGDDGASDGGESIGSTEEPTRYNEVKLDLDPGASEGSIKTDVGNIGMNEIQPRRNGMKKFAVKMKRVFFKYGTIIAIFIGILLGLMIVGSVHLFLVSRRNVDTGMTSNDNPTFDLLQTIQTAAENLITTPSPSTAKPSIAPLRQDNEKTSVKLSFSGHESNKTRRKSEEVYTFNTPSFSFSLNRPSERNETFNLALEYNTTTPSKISRNGNELITVSPEFMKSIGNTITNIGYALEDFFTGRYCYCHETYHWHRNGNTQTYWSGC